MKYWHIPGWEEASADLNELVRIDDMARKLIEACLAASQKAHSDEAKDAFDDMATAITDVLGDTTTGAIADRAMCVSRLENDREGNRP